MTKKHPMQPIEKDADGNPRFKANKLVEFLKTWAGKNGMPLNELSILLFSQEDWDQFNQLIGYSVSGFGDTANVNPKLVKKADKRAAKL